MNAGCVVKGGKRRAQIALEFLLVVTLFYVLLGWPIRHYLALSTSSAPLEKQLEGIARGVAVLANKACVASYNSSANVSYEMPCLYIAGKGADYRLAAAGSFINITAANATASRASVCPAAANFSAGCGVAACISASNASVSITLGSCG